MKRIIKPLWLTLAALSAILTVVSCVKELAVQEHEVSFESSLTTELSQIEESDSIVATQLIVTEEKVECPRPTKYSVSFTYDEKAGTLFFFGESVQSGKPIALSSLSDLTLTYQAKELVDNKVNVTIENDAPKKLSKELVWNILADGWEIASMTANGVDILASKSFVVKSNTTVKVVFKRLPPKTYKVTLTKEGDGTVAISGADDLDAVVTGSKLTVTAEPADGWGIGSITANGKDITADKSFIVTSNTVVKVVFKKQPPKTYKVTLVCSEGGEATITGADDLNRVPAGTELHIIATPGENKELKSLTVNGKFSGFSFVVTEDTVVKVSFADIGNIVLYLPPEPNPDGDVPVVPPTSSLSLSASK